MAEKRKWRRQPRPLHLYPDTDTSYAACKPSGRAFCPPESFLGPSDSYRLLVSLSACPVPMLARHRPHPAVATFTLRLPVVMLMKEARVSR